MVIIMKTSKWRTPSLPIRYLNFPLLFIRSKSYLALLCMLVSSLLVCYALWVALAYIHCQTYVWQSTILADVLFPVRRRECSSGNTILSSANRQTIDTESTSTEYKIGVLLLYDDNDGTWSNHLMTRVLRNRYFYCKKYGYTLLNANHLIDKSRPTAWSKLIAMEHYLAIGNLDYIVYIDMDIVIMNFEVRLEKFISAVSDVTKTTSPDIIMTKDWGGLNTGVWFAKNTNWTRALLLEAWNQKDLLKKYSRNGRKHPFEYEQRTFHYLTDSNVWRQRALPKYPGNSSAILSHIAVLPQCAMNSYSLHPFYWKGKREVSHYIPGDFLIHFAGKKGPIKSKMIAHYLTVAENSFQYQQQQQLQGGAGTGAVEEGETD